MQCYCIQQFHEQEEAIAVCFVCERAICQRCLVEDQHKDHQNKMLMKDFFALCEQYADQQNEQQVLVRQSLEQQKKELIKSIEQTINMDMQFNYKQPQDQTDFRKQIQQIKKQEQYVNSYFDKYFVLLSNINSQIKEFNDQNWEINQIQEIKYSLDSKIKKSQEINQSVDQISSMEQYKDAKQIKDQVCTFTFYNDQYYTINEKILQVFDKNMKILYSKQYDEKVYRILVYEDIIVLHQFNKLLVEYKGQQMDEIDLQNQDLCRIRIQENKQIGLCFRNNVAWIIKLNSLENNLILNEKDGFVLSDICLCDNLIYISFINQPTISIWRDVDQLKMDDLKIDEQVSCMTIPQNKKLIIIGCKGFQIWNRIEKELLKTVKLDDFVFDIQTDIHRIVVLGQSILVYDKLGTDQLYKGSEFVYEFKLANKQILYTTHGVLKIL